MAISSTHPTAIHSRMPIHESEPLFPAFSPPWNKLIPVVMTIYRVLGLCTGSWDRPGPPAPGQSGGGGGGGSGGGVT